MEHFCGGHIQEPFSTQAHNGGPITITDRDGNS